VVLLFFAIFKKDRLVKRKFLLAAVFTFLFFSNSFILDAFMRAWEIPPIKNDQFKEGKIAVVLTGMTSYSPLIDRIQFNDRTDRIMQAIDLYNDHKISKVILCGGSGSLVDNDKRSLTGLHTFLTKNGIPDSLVIDEFDSRNTYENAIRSKLILDKLNDNDSILLVTSAFHMRRASGCFAKQGIKLIPYSTDCYAGPVKFEIDYLLLPSALTMLNWEKLMHEWIGCIAYKVTGRI
jgi:uncharacterized SAM-binding protein YcdF (DUF218 family)